MHIKKISLWGIFLLLGHWYVRSSLTASQQPNVTSNANSVTQIQQQQWAKDFVEIYQEVLATPNPNYEDLKILLRLYLQEQQKASQNPIDILKLWNTLQLNNQSITTIFQQLLQEYSPPQQQKSWSTTLSQVTQLIEQWTKNDVLIAEDLKNLLETDPVFITLNNQEKIQLLSYFRKKYPHSQEIQLALQTLILSYQSSKKDTTKPINKTQEQADKLTKASYFSPEMQYSVLLAVNRSFTIDITTGKVQNLPTAQEIINSTADNQIKINALYSALEATKVAIFVAGLEAAYEYPGAVFVTPTVNPELTKILKKQESDITTYLNKLSSSWISQATSSIYNLIYGPSSTKLIHISLPIQDNQDIYTLPPELIQQIIKTNDFKQQHDYKSAANILAQQCFIAQQNFLNNNFLGTGNIPLLIKIENDINAHNYIFNNFFSIEELCTLIQEQVNRINSAQNPQAAHQIKLQAHKLFLDIREAIQTALYITNRNSTFNFALTYIPDTISYYVPSILKVIVSPITSIVSSTSSWIKDNIFLAYFDQTRAELLKLDIKLSKLCKDEKYGATSIDTRRDRIWTNITWIAGGLAIGAAAVYIGYYHGSAISSAGKNAWNGLTKQSAPQITDWNDVIKNEGVAARTDLNNFIDSKTISSLPQTPDINWNDMINTQEPAQTVAPIIAASQEIKNSSGILNFISDAIYDSIKDGVLPMG